MRIRNTITAEAWDSSHAYEQYVGRWSRKIATEFLRWIAPLPDLAWADVGCGTGALSSAILDRCEPSLVSGIDSSQGFVSQARQNVGDPRVQFETGDATHLPWNAATWDVTVSGLVLNFVRDHESMAREMWRVTRPGGSVAAYVWDYAGGMQMMRCFWDAAIAISPNDANLDQAERFPLCQPGPLQALFERVGLKSVTVRAIDIPTVFQNFEDYWNPFLGRTGAAPTYLASVTDEVRERIRLYLKSRLASSQDGPIEMTARAWAVQGIVQ
jgi:trans-aconitate methyltransferase